MAPFKLSNEKSFHTQSAIIAAMIPLIVWGCYVFGTRTITVLLVSLFFSIVPEIIFSIITKNISQFSPVRPIICGMLTALILPVSVPLWAAALGGLITSMINLINFKGPVHCCIINPVASSGIILFGLFGKAVERYTAPFDTFDALQLNTFSITQISPILQTFKDGTDSITNSTILNIFLGRDSGSIGEVSALLIIISAIFLIYKGYISWHIPVLFVSTVFLFSFFFPVGNCESIYCAASETLSGGVLFLSVFVASMPSASPITNGGKIVFGVSCGLITMLLRRYTGIVDGSLFAVAIVSCFSTILDNFTGNKYFSYMTKYDSKQHPQKTDLETLLNG